MIVARYGGEEFALLLPGLDIEHAVALAEEARRSIKELLMTHADSPCGIVTISIGVESRVPTLANRPPAWSRWRIVRSTMQKGAVATR